MLMILLIKSMKQIARIHKKAILTYMVTSKYLKFFKALVKLKVVHLTHGLNP